MLIEAPLLTTTAGVVSFVIGTTVLAAALLTAPWKSWLGDGEHQWVWLGSLGLLLAVWSMHAGFTPGLSLRFLLMTALTLMNGWQLAVIGAALVLLVMCLTGQADWASFGANLVCVGIVPALFTAWFHEQVHNRLPHNYFVYFFVTVFLGSALAYNLAGLARLGFLALSGSLPPGHVLPEYVAVLPFMSFGEGVANGMIMAMAVVYRPQWVMSFDDRIYLGKRDG
jgi:uncharacterized membrane protein